jgi:hypothetical protein
LGLAVAAGAERLASLPVFAVRSTQKPLLPFAIGIVVLGSANALGINH